MKGITEAFIFRIIQRFFPLLMAVATISFPFPNLVKAGLIVFIFVQFLGPLRRVDWILFFAANVIFVISDYQAIQNGFFFFRSPDVLGLPYWEFVSWGFWIVFAHRNLPKHFPRNLDLRAVLMAIAFSQAFALIPDKGILLFVTSAIVVLALFTFRSIVDMEYILMFSGMGLLVETCGLRFDIWGYAEKDVLVSSVQFVVMWAGTGLFFRHLVGPFLKENKGREYIHRTHFVPWIESQGHANWGQCYAYQDFIKMSDLALAQANMRRSIECLREALMSAQTSLERARAHVMLGQRYRMIIQMRNAKKEFELAFHEMNLDLPGNYTLQALKSALSFFSAVLSPPALVKDPHQREVLELKAELYEEIGLSGYYMHENLTMLQASMMAYGYSQQLGPSLGQINWLGGTICILTLRKWNWLIPKIKTRMERILTESSDPVLHTKAQVWRALAEDYLGNAKGSAEIFRAVIDGHREHMRPADLHMVTMTLSLNYLIRGKFRESIDIIDEMFRDEEDQSVSLFSQLRPYVEWSKLGGMSFLEPSEKLAPIIQTSKAIFSYTDQEDWALTQYLGYLLLVSYKNGGRDMDQVNEIEERFRVTGLTPRKTFLEANFFWMALALVRLEQLGRREIAPGKVRDLLQEIKSLRGHPVRDQFLKILNQRFSILQNESENFLDEREFQEQLRQTENLFALTEYSKNIALKAKGSHAEV